MRKNILILLCILFFGFTSIKTFGFFPIDAEHYRAPKYIVVYDILENAPLNYNGIGTVQNRIFWNINDAIDFYKELKEEGHELIKIYPIGKEFK